MVILLHISAALASLLVTTGLFFRPSVARFKLAYGLVGGTLISGTYLIIADHSHLLQSCTSGLLYLGGVSTALVIAQRRFARQNN